MTWARVVGGHGVVLLRRGQQQFERREFRVEAQLGGGRAADAVRQQFVDDGLQQIDRQVVGEVEVGQIVAHGAHALQPDAFFFLAVGIVEALALLREDGFLFRFHLPAARA